MTLLPIEIVQVRIVYLVQLLRLIWAVRVYTVDRLNFTNVLGHVRSLISVLIIQQVERNTSLLRGVPSLMRGETSLLRGTVR